MGRLSNISLSVFKAFLLARGLSLIRVSGGHELWSRPGLLRPVVIQTHIDPIPEFIILNCLCTIGMTRKDFEKYLKQ